MDKDQIKQTIAADLEEGETECRWCFAIDLQRVEANIIAQYDFPDATLLHLRCPTCGGEFSYCFHAWGKDYLKNIISKLHPELEGGIGDDLFNNINDRVWPKYTGI